MHAYICTYLKIKIHLKNSLCWDFKSFTVTQPARGRKAYVKCIFYLGFPKFELINLNFTKCREFPFSISSNCFLLTHFLLCGTITAIGPEVLVLSPPLTVFFTDIC